MIKKLRKFSNMTLLCVTQNEQLKLDIKNKFLDVKELICIEAKDYNDDLVQKKFDILLIDYDSKGSLDIMEKISQSNPLLPKIVILDDCNENNIVKCINNSAAAVVKYPVDFDDLKLAVIVALNQSKRSDKVLINNSIYYDAYRERFYDDNGSISFTNFEFKLLKLLLDNSDRIVSYDEIKDSVWKEKKMSIFTMRNVVNKIRNKTYYGIIRNNSSKGYQIDSQN